MYSNRKENVMRFLGIFLMGSLCGMSQCFGSYEYYGATVTDAVSVNVERRQVGVSKADETMFVCSWEQGCYLGGQGFVYSLSYTVTTNMSVYSRSGTIEYKWQDHDTYYWRNGSIYVEQKGYPATVTVDRSTFDIMGGEGKFNINTGDGVQWNAYVESWDQGDESDWIELSAESGYGSGRLNFTVRPNVLGRSRIATVHVASKTLTISQNGGIDYVGAYCKPQGNVKVTGAVTANEESVFLVDGNIVLSETNVNEFIWQPLSKGSHALEWRMGSTVYSLAVNVAKLSFATMPAPNSPMAKDNNVSITPTTRNFGVSGGGNAILVSGSSATWTAAVSDPWITLNATSGNVGYPVAYTVSANTNVEQRIGYVYVSGWTHTITQDGVGGTISPGNKNFESAGGKGTISVSAASKMVWQARPNVDWLSITPTSGTGAGNVTYQVAPYNEVATRQGTLTVAGNTFTVFQYGRRMKLDSYSVTNNYETHVIPITVNALAITQWSVTPNNSWLSVVDAGNGQGGDLVSIAIAENPSYKARTGTVTIGTETFTVTQQGRPTAALSFAVSPANSTASVEGANGIITVTATPDLPWAATSGANWLTVYAATANGAGNGNVVYSASPNPTLSQRTGTITITPEAASGMAAKTHKVTQPAAQSALSMSGYEFEAAGESCSIDVSVADIVQWNISESLDWITVNGSTSRTGPGSVVLQAAANNTVYPRSGTVKIAGKTFNVSQKARGVELEYDTKLFGTDGGDESISIHPDGNVSWTAVASDATWITIFQGDSGTGDGEILYIVAPYVGDGTARVGWITVGDKKVYITQRAYELSIEPNGTNVVGNAGAGEFGVSANINDVWTAIVTEPWITLVSGYDSGTGSGTVRFLYTENATGKTRTGKIIVSGEVYTLEQRARQMVAITATVEHGGHVSGGGSYDLGTQVTLTAIPDSGYKFSYWTGAESSMQNPLIVTADVAKSYTAVFEPLPIAFTSVESSEDGVSLAWNNLAWATTYRIYRGITSVPSSAVVLAELANDGNCVYLDETGDVDVEYWYWIEAEGVSDDVMSDPMTGRKEKPIVYSPITYENLRGASNQNPATYQEGTLVTFENPGTVTGYTFAGWTPAQITAGMTGAQTVRAAWTANSYSIAYNANGGSGTTESTVATYDSEATVAANGFVWAGHVFVGWATNETGESVYAAGQLVTNLTAQSSGVVTLYAVWEPLVVAAPTMTPSDGAMFTEESCTVTLECATAGAVIYFSTNGSTPRMTDAFRYTGPFAITDTATVKAVAVVDGVKSEYMTGTITKRLLTLADATGAADLVFTTGGDAVWTPIADATAQSGLSARSGEIGDSAGYGEYTTSWIETSVSGAGTLTFAWKVECEFDDSGDASWDHVECFADGREVFRMDGTSGWETKGIEFDGAGTHVVRWTFVKDDYNEDVFADRAWLSGVIWTPSGAAEGIAIRVDGAATEYETAADGKTRTATVAEGTTAEDVKVFVGGVDVTAGFKVAVEGTTATVVLKEPYDAARSEIAPYQPWADNGDGSVTLNVEVVPGLYYAADSAATIEALKRPGAAEPAKAGDAVVAPKQEGVKGFYKVWVSDAPIEAE